MNDNRKKNQQRLNSLPSNNTQGRRGGDVQVVVQNPVITNQRKPKSRFALEVSTIANGLFSSVVAPALKTLLSDALSSGLDIALYGQGGGPRNNSRYGLYSNRHTGYQNQPRRSYQRDSRMNLGNRGQQHNQHSQPPDEQLFFTSRQDASAVLDMMYGRLEEYGYVTVADMYHAVGKSPDFGLERWGWSYIDSADIRRVQRGYVIELSDPEYS